MSRKKILITGATGTVAKPIAEQLAQDPNNEVWAIARFSSPEAKADLEGFGIKTHFWDLGISELGDLPKDFTHVCHSGILGPNPPEIYTQIERNGYATAQLMDHCRTAEAFLYVSTGGVYRNLENDHRHNEANDPIGGEAPYMPAYPMQKAGCEAIVIALSRLFNLKSIIARANVTFGPDGFGGLPSRYYETMLAGKPVAMPKDRDNYCMPMYTDDCAMQVPKLWDVATIPATVVNWGGDEMVSQYEMARYVSEITGVPVVFEEAKVSFLSVGFDNTRRISLIGNCEVDWREGVRRTLEKRFPGSVKH